MNSNMNSNMSRLQFELAELVCELVKDTFSGDHYQGYLI